MRIVSGQARGIRLLTSRDPAVRPTSDRVKEAVFASLGPLSGLTVVDLFAGTGALGLEALSRGAGTVCWIERAGGNCRLIRENLAKVERAMHDVGSVRIVRGDVRRAPHVLADVRPDLVLADPPYSPGPGEAGAEALLTDAALARWATGARLVVEQSRRAVLPAALACWRLTRRKIFGNTVVYFFLSAADRDA